MDSIKSSALKCVHGVYHPERVSNPNDATPNQECSVCCPIVVPANARYVIARDETGKFVNIADATTPLAAE
jgi:hypothetical protein